MEFPMSNETTTELSRRLKGIQRKKLVEDLEVAIKERKGKSKELPLQFTLQCIPLSTNKMSGARKTFETKEYLNYRRLIALKASGTYGISKKDKFILYVEVGYSNKRADADNCLKPLLDSIVACIDDDFDDCQVYRIEVDKVIVKKGQEYIKVRMELL